MSVEILAPLLASGRLMRSAADCLYHGRLCSLKTAQKHIAGTSCIPYSRRGVQLGHKDDATIYAIAFIGLRLLLQESDITLERPTRTWCLNLFTLITEYFIISVILIPPSPSPRVQSSAYCPPRSIFNFFRRVYDFMMNDVLCPC